MSAFATLMGVKAMTSAPTSRNARGVRTVPSQKRREFPYGHGFFVQRLTLLLALVAYALIVLGLQLAAPPTWVAGIAVLFVAFTLVWGISPLLTNHWLTTSRLILRQGWYFRGAFPLREIESVSKVDEVVFDVDSQTAFLETFGGRMSSLAPVEAKRPDPYLRD